MASGSSSKSSSKSTPNDIQAPEYGALRTPVANAFGNIATHGFSAVPQYSGPLYAPMGVDELAAMGAVTGYDPTGSNPTQASTYKGYQDTIGGAWLAPGKNPFLDASYAAAARPVYEAASDQELANRSLYTGAGQRIQTSSPYARASQRTDQAAQRALAAVGEDVYGGNLQKERDAQLRATQAGGQYGLQDIAQQFKVLQTKLQAEELPRMIADLGVTRGIEAYNSALQYYRSVLLGGLQGTQPVAGEQQQGKGSGWAFTIV